jgi:hypothetical protein
VLSFPIERRCRRVGIEAMGSYKLVSAPGKSGYRRNSITASLRHPPVTEPATRPFSPKSIADMLPSPNCSSISALFPTELCPRPSGSHKARETGATPPPPPDFTIAVPFATSAGLDADLYVNSKYFGSVFASAEPPDVAARLAATQRPFAARCLTDKAPQQ